MKVEFIRGQGATLRLSQVTFHHPKLKAQITFFPMMHIAQPSFYDEINGELGQEKYHYFLLEGVNYQALHDTSWYRTRFGMYHLAAQSLGLVAQERALEVPEHKPRLSLDMESASFQQAVRKLPLHYRLLLFFLSPLMWLAVKLLGGKRLLRLLSAREMRRRDNKIENEMDELLSSKRDRAMRERLEAFLMNREQEGQPFYAAVVAGASHMPALLGVLREKGYCLGTIKWRRVFGDTLMLEE